MNEILKDIKEQYQYNDWSQKSFLEYWTICFVFAFFL